MAPRLGRAEVEAIFGRNLFARQRQPRRFRGHRRTRRAQAVRVRRRVLRGRRVAGVGPRRRRLARPAAGRGVPRAAVTNSRRSPPTSRRGAIGRRLRARAVRGGPGRLTMSAGSTTDLAGLTVGIWGFGREGVSMAQNRRRRRRRPHRGRRRRRAGGRFEEPEGIAGSRRCSAAPSTWPGCATATSCSSAPACRGGNRSSRSCGARASGSPAPPTGSCPATARPTIGVTGHQGQEHHRVVPRPPARPGSASTPSSRATSARRCRTCRRAPARWSSPSCRVSRPRC